MRRFSFRLEAVLRVRRLQEDLARAAVASADAELAAARSVAARHVDELRVVADRPVPAGASAFLARRDCLARHADAVARTAVEVADAGDRRAERLDDWHIAHRAVDGLERVEERAREQHRVEGVRDEDRHVDEIVVARFGRRPS